jgi:prevent-host-death family protein
MVFPEVVSVRDLQRNYRKVLDRAAKAGPVFVLRNNKPEAAVVSVALWETIINRLSSLEELSVMGSIKTSEKEYSAGKAKELKGSLLDI